jgi:hypothetical protein
MYRFATLPVLLACLLFAGVCYGEEKIIGEWGDRDEANVYVFRQNGEFEYYRRTSAAVGGDTSREGKGEPAVYERSSGVWTSGKGICSTGLQKGDLMIYVEETQCCMMTQTVAGKLVLNAVFSKGTGDLPICRNRVLNRMEGLPGTRKTES